MSKNTFDRKIGPDGAWIVGSDGSWVRDPQPVAAPSGSELNEREEFALRCLNAAANLYGVLSMDEFVRLYNVYAKDHPAPVSSEMTVEELDCLVDRLHDLSWPDEPSEDDILNRPEVWFSTWRCAKDVSVPRVIVCESLTECDHEIDGTPRTPEERKAIDDEDDRRITHRIAGTVAAFKKVDLKILSEREFLDYEEPMFSEDTDEAKKLSRFIQREYGLYEMDADIDVSGIMSEIRRNGPTTVTALEYIRDACEWRPQHFKDFMKLVRALCPVVNETRTWKGRGRSQDELFRMGVVPHYEKEEIYDVFEIGDEERDAAADDDFGDGDEDEDEESYIRAEDIPVSHYEGPVDFKFVKDPEKRAAKLFLYNDVRQVTRDYVRANVIEKMTKKARHAAAVRLGFLKKGEELEKLDPTLDCVVGDFASMMDDQDGEPIVKRALRDKDKLDALDARAASYYENYRYTWLEVLAVKAGLGVKCRDLLTGEDLFLMETSFSLGDVKGMTICVGIAPIVDVYMALGVIAPANFENPSVILKIVLTGLGLPTELPIRLTFADQARFAAETIRRIHATGRFSTLDLG